MYVDTDRHLFKPFSFAWQPFTCNVTKVSAVENDLQQAKISTSWLRRILTNAFTQHVVPSLFTDI